MNSTPAQSCRARITYYDHLSASHRVGRRCTRRPDANVCGIDLCWQHIRAIVAINSRGEVALSCDAEERFRSWRVVPTRAFDATGLDEFI